MGFRAASSGSKSSNSSDTAIAVPYPSLELFPRIRKVGESNNEIEDPATTFSSEFEIETQVEMLLFSCFVVLFLGFLWMILLF
jgi:hypothetical protein